MRTRIRFQSFLIPFCLIFFALDTILVSGQCQVNQQSTLILLKNSLQFDSSSSTKLASWNRNTTDCCTWAGVTCSVSGQVIGLDLSNATISDVLNDSSVLFNLKNLKSLNLAANNFQLSYIPLEFATLTNLSYLNLSNSGFSGQVPVELSQLTKLETLDFSSNKLQGEFPRIFVPAMMNASATVFTIFDISSNRFSGEIPSTIGILKGLYSLNVSHNEFTGSIPSSIGNLSRLESLDMSSNNLTGEIPTALTRLTFLSNFNLSYNQLQGRIPTGSQFQTFGDGSYLGNEGLCGSPISRRCNSSIAPAPNYAPSSQGFCNEMNSKLVMMIVTGLIIHIVCFVI